MKPPRELAEQLYDEMVRDHKGELRISRLTAAIEARDRETVEACGKIIDRFGAMSIRPSMRDVADAVRSLWNRRAASPASIGVPERPACSCPTFNALARGSMAACAVHGRSPAPAPPSEPVTCGVCGIPTAPCGHCPVCDFGERSPGCHQPAEPPSEPRGDE